MEFVKSVLELLQSDIPEEVLRAVIVFLIATSIIGVSKWLYRQISTTNWKSVWATALSPAGWITAGVIGVLLLFGSLYREVRQHQTDISTIWEMVLALKSEEDGEQSPPSPIQLNPNAQAANEASVNAGFWPDPAVWDIEGGGQFDASHSTGQDCVGYATRAPNLRLQWNGESDELRIFFTAANGAEDSTLVVNLPDGSWSCNDDSEFSLDPLVLLDAPEEGQYDIWVGSYRPDGSIFGELSVTELNLGPTPYPRADQ